ncbi:acyl carrier protein [Streptomyces crystallinus]|uniref:Phosphopantetheine-binding protein n=1 Tax=Streptomyces crystallinus TaxID=68191 RepID=A0ABP3QSI6_9ACTN
MATTLELITDALAETFAIDRADVTADRTFDELGMDSLALVEMGLMLQETTGITLNDTQMPQTVGELAAMLDAQQADKNLTPTKAAT